MGNIVPPPPKDRPPPKSGAKAKVDPPTPPPKQDPGSPQFMTPSGSAPDSGTSTPQTISLEKFNALVARLNQLHEALVRECKDHYKNESVSLSMTMLKNFSVLIIYFVIWRKNVLKSRSQ